MTFQDSPAPRLRTDFLPRTSSSRRAEITDDRFELRKQMSRCMVAFHTDRDRIVDAGCHRRLARPRSVSGRILKRSELGSVFESKRHLDAAGECTEWICEPRRRAGHACAAIARSTAIRAAGDASAMDSAPSEFCTGTCSATDADRTVSGVAATWISCSETVSEPGVSESAAADKSSAIAFSSSAASSRSRNDAGETARGKRFVSPFHSPRDAVAVAAS